MSYDLQSSYGNSSDTSNAPATTANDRITHPVRIGEVLVSDELKPILSGGEVPKHCLSKLPLGSKTAFGDFVVSASEGEVSVDTSTEKLVLRNAEIDSETTVFLDKPCSGTLTTEKSVLADRNRSDEAGILS